MGAAVSGGMETKQAKECDRMNDKAGLQQLMALDQAVMAAILEAVGEVTVQREAMNSHFRKQTAVRAEQTEEGFRLWVERA